MNSELSMVGRAALLAGAMLASASPALAAWSSTPNANVAVSTVTGRQQTAKVVRDALGSTIICWEDERSGELDGFGSPVADVYALRLLPTGEIAPGWTVDGTPVCTASSDQAWISMLADNSGGVYLVWSDSRPSTPGTYVQHMTVTGQVAAGWPADGLRVAGTPAGIPSLCSDGSGGVLVSWGSYVDVRAQRYTSAGVRMWDPAGVVVGGPSPGSFGNAVGMCPDGAGGAMLGWYRYWGANGVGFWVQHMGANGSIVSGWPAQGDSLAASSTAHIFPPQLVSDGSGGAIFVYLGIPTGGYALRMKGDHTVAPGWPALGKRFTANGGPTNGMSPIADGSGGVYVGYSAGASNAFVVRLTASGLNAAGWPDGGVALDPGSFIPGLAPTPDGGVVVGWGTFSGNLKAQRLTGSGTVASGWPVGGVVLGTAVLGSIDFQSIPVTADGNGGLVAAWNDNRQQINAGMDIYAQRIGGNASLGGEPRLTRVRDIPYDQGGQVLVEWSASYADCGPGYDITQYSVWRQVPTLANLTARPGARYHETATNGVAQYWEYTATVPARALPGYGYVAATTTDSLPGSNPPTSFMVMSETAGGFPNWSSAPDSGYSVDNLPPSTPSPFTGTYAAGATDMNWGISMAPDLAAYRLYRGSNAGFSPGPSNLVTTTTANSYADSPGGPFIYKLTAIDVHANESAPATLVPAGTVNAEDENIRSLELSLAGANPSRSGPVLALSLPLIGAVRVSIYDTRGRRLRVLVDRVLESGRHEVRWDGLDGAGARAPGGVYFARLEAGGELRTSKLVLSP